MPDVNHAALVAAAAANLVVGFAWFTLLADRWTGLVGKTREELQGPRQGYVLALVAALVMAYALAFFVAWAGADNVWQGALVGLLAGLGFVATTKGVTYVFEWRPRDLFLIDAGHHVVALVVMGAILGAWP